MIRELAEKLGIHEFTLIKWEEDRRSHPRYLKKMSRVIPGLSAVAQDSNQKNVTNNYISRRTVFTGVSARNSNGVNTTTPLIGTFSPEIQRVAPCDLPIGSHMTITQAILRSITAH